MKTFRNGSTKKKRETPKDMPPFLKTTSIKRDTLELKYAPFILFDIPKIKEKSKKP